MPISSYTYDSAPIDPATQSALMQIEAERQAFRLRLIQEEEQKRLATEAAELQRLAKERADQQTEESRQTALKAWRAAGGEESDFLRAWPQIRQAQLTAAATQGDGIRWRASDIEVGYIPF